jgi:hypothetical protein
MKHEFSIVLLLAFIGKVSAQQQFPTNILSINGFRNPSIGLEYQKQQVSVHAGYYPTNFESNVTTEFLKAGINIWFFSVDKKEIPSTFYIGTSYLRGLTRDYDNKNALALEAGFRWYIWKGLNCRLGIIALTATGESLKINPTPSIGYSIQF